MNCLNILVRSVLFRIQVLFALAVITFSFDGAAFCELQRINLNLESGNKGQLVYDECALRNPRLVIDFKKLMTPSELKKFMLGVLESRRDVFVRARFAPQELKDSLNSTKKSDWDVGRLNKHICFDKTKSNLICSDFVLMKYRVRPGKNRFRLIYNRQAVQFR